MKCPNCGSGEIHEVDVDQDRQGNYIRAVVCFECNYELQRQDVAGQCLHNAIEVDEIGRGWCTECGAYLGERWLR